MTDTINIGGLIRAARKTRFGSMRKAATAIVITDARGTRSLSGEGLRKIETGLSLPSANVLSALITGWELGKKEADQLRYAVHAAHERKAGYEPRQKEDLGENREAVIASAVGDILSKSKILVEGMVEEEDDQEAFLEELKTIADKTLREYFR